MNAIWSFTGRDNRGVNIVAYFDASLLCAQKVL